jgi:hypothetical protein
MADGDTVGVIFAFSGDAGTSVSTATTSAEGKVELATTAETVTGTDTDRAVTAAGLHGALAGLTDTTIVAADQIIFADTSDSNALKEDTVQGILDLASGGGAWTLIGTQVASDSSSIAQTGLSSTYDTYAIALSDMMPVDDNTTGYLKIGSSGGYATDYGYIGEKLYFDSATFGSNRSASSSDGILIGGQVGNAAGEGVGAIGFLTQPGDATGRPRFCGSYVCMDSSTAAQVGGVWGAVNSVIVVDRVSFQFASGNITSGRMTVWGISHA